MPVPNLFSLMPFAFMAVGLFFAVRGVRSVTADRRRRRSWPVHPGRVVASRLEDGHFRSRVTYQLDGREYRFWNRYASTTMTDPVGRELEVLVNPANPGDAVVSGGLVGATLVGGSFIAFGVMAIAFGLFWLRMPTV